MSQRFVISDHHFGHDGIYAFVDDAGARLRPWASCAEEADEMMIAAHNSRVHPKDTCYFLGDVAIRRHSLDLLARMNGRKILIRGNHDIFKLSEYARYFADVRGSWKIDRFFLQHQPVHPDSIPAWCRANIHGHLHHRQVMVNHDGAITPDPRYVNVSIEQIGLTPLLIDEIAEKLQTHAGVSA